MRKELAATAPVVLGIEYKLQQVFLNLFLNARDAMPKGGWLSIVTRAALDGATVEVADTGSGIPAEQLSRIYDPFFTTKDIGKGTGLGLSITYGIVQEHGGTITCDSSPGQGTRFTLALPLAAARRMPPRSIVRRSVAATRSAVRALRRPRQIVMLVAIRPQGMKRYETARF